MEGEEDQEYALILGVKQDIRKQNKPMYSPRKQK